jgi:hypothetical protein
MKHNAKIEYLVVFAIAILTMAILHLLINEGELSKLEEIILTGVGIGILLIVLNFNKNKFKKKLK